MVLLQPDRFLNELTSLLEKSTEKGSVWATLKRSSLKSKVQRNKMKTAGQSLEYRCLVRATDGKKTISTSVWMKEHDCTEEEERKDKKKSAETDKKVGGAAPAAAKKK